MAWWSTIFATALMTVSAAPVLAQNNPPVQPLPYDQLAHELAGRIDFETLPLHPEPGLSYNRILTAPGVEIGEHLVGQNLQVVDEFDTLTGTPRPPLEVAIGRPDENIAVAYHAGFGSNAAFPLGPNGFAKISGRGEGAMAIVFSHDIQRFGLRLHADYQDPLGTRPAPGMVTFEFFAADGSLVAAPNLHPTLSITSLGFLLNRPVRAVTITHKDPGGLAVDDIIYPLPALSS